MTNPERRKLVFLYPKYKLNIVSCLNPTIGSPQDHQKILNEHIGRESTFFIETGGRTSHIIFPSTLQLAGKMSQEEREAFLSTGVNQMHKAERIFLKCAVNFSNN